MSVVAIVVTDGSGVIHGSGEGGKRRDASPVGRAVIGLGRGGVRLTVVRASKRRERGWLSLSAVVMVVGCAKIIAFWLGSFLRASSRSFSPEIRCKKMF